MMKENTNKDFVRMATAGFLEFCTKTYGFVPNYEELRRIATDLLFGEYMDAVQQFSQSKEDMDQAIVEATEALSGAEDENQAV